MGNRVSERANFRPEYLGNLSLAMWISARKVVGLCIGTTSGAEQKFVDGNSASSLLAGLHLLDLDREKRPFASTDFPDTRKCLADLSEADHR